MQHAVIHPSTFPERPEQALTRRGGTGNPGSGRAESPSLPGKRPFPANRSERSVEQVGQNALFRHGTQATSPGWEHDFDQAPGDLSSNPPDGGPRQSSRLAALCTQPDRPLSCAQSSKESAGSVNVPRPSAESLPSQRLSHRSHGHSLPVHNNCSSHLVAGHGEIRLRFTSTTLDAGRASGCRQRPYLAAGRGLDESLRDLSSGQSDRPDGLHLNWNSPVQADLTSPPPHLRRPVSAGQWAPFDN